MSPSRRSLFEFDAQVSAEHMRRRGEVIVSVSTFVVCMLERYHRRNPSLALIGGG